MENKAATEKKNVDFPEKDQYAQNMEKLKITRKELLKIADYIIPGHGNMFKT